MAATYDTSAVSAVSFGATSVTVNVTVGANSNRAMEVDLYHTIITATGITATVGGASATAVANTDTAAASTCRTLMFGRIAPGTGVQAVAAAWTGPTSTYIAGKSFFNCDQTAPFANGNKGGAITGAPTCTPTAAGTANDISSACYAGASAAGRTQTLRYGPQSGANEDFEGTTGAAGATHAYSDNSQAWAMSATNVIGVAAGGDSPMGQASL